MGLHKLSAGDGYTYLTRQVATHDRAETGYHSLGDYYAEKGESPGEWVGNGLAGLGMTTGEQVTEAQMKALFGHGRHPNAADLAPADAALGRPYNVYNSATQFRVEAARAFTEHNLRLGRQGGAPIPAEQRARIRTELGLRMFNDRYHRPPVDARELAGFIARASRPATTAVAGYDLTFSPVKSVSTLWALAPRPVAAQIADAHRAAVADTLAWLEHEVALTRVGRGGVRQVPVRGLIAVSFTHRDSRAGDPDLHTHVAISNKVQTRQADGNRWLALDGRLLFKAKVSASERYNTRLECELVARLGVRFVDRTTAAGKRPVREIDGVSPALMRHWSTRRRDIERRQSQLSGAFQRTHGRPPTAVEATALAQQANLETRGAKHEPRSEGSQRAVWGQQAREALVDPNAVDDMLARTLHRRPAGAVRPDPEWVSHAAHRVVEALEATRATWQTWHVRAEAERQARAGEVPLAHVSAVVDQVVQHTLRKLSVRLGTPGPAVDPARLRRPDGQSSYEVHGSAAYTSTRILAAEQQLLDAAGTCGGRVISQTRVALAVAGTADGTVLDAGQTAMVRDLATSGAHLQVALAPAGAGKTTALSALARAWRDAGGTVLGLAPSAAAADQLRHAVGGNTDTLAKVLWDLTTHHTTGLPHRLASIGPESLVLIDEAGMAGTCELATVVGHVLARGGSVRLIGDDQQLAAVEAGGVLRDLAQHPSTVSLTQARRFHDPAEAAATLALREGDASALGFYADHHRIHLGDLGSAADQAYDAWLADRRAGLDAVLLAPTRDLVRRLNERARTDRLTTGSDSVRSGSPKEVRLSDETHASVGDVVVTRRNDRRLKAGPTDWVKNGDRWKIEHVPSDGALVARHLEHRRCVRLPAEYVREHVQLGYAATVHSAQGATVDATHTILTGDEPRQVLYVALSRGRLANHLYLAASPDGDPHDIVRPQAMRPPTAIEVLAGILARDGSQQSATTTRHDLDSAANRLGQAALRYHDALGVAAEEFLGAARLTQLDQQLELALPGVTTQPAYPTLRGHLALRDVEGHDPLHLVTRAASVRELETADDSAAVLDWRIGGTRTTGAPLPWLPGVPAQLLHDPTWGDYLHDRADRVRHLAEQVFHEAAGSDPDNHHPWTEVLRGPGNAALRGDVAVWRAAFNVAPSDPRPTGPRQLADDAAAHQCALDRRVSSLAAPTRPEHNWAAELPEPITTDAHRSVLDQRLETLAHTGADVTGLIQTALAEPRALPTEAAAAALWWRIVGIHTAALRHEEMAASADDGRRQPAADRPADALFRPTMVRRPEELRSRLPPPRPPAGRGR